MATLNLPSIQSVVGDLRRGVYFGTAGAIGGFCGDLVTEIFLDHGPREFLYSLLNVGFWFGCIGALITIAIFIGHERYAGKSLSGLVRGIGGLAYGSAFGWFSGFVSGAFAQGIYRVIGPTETLRVICWGLSGGLLGLALGSCIANLTRPRGLAGGLVGGVAGGIVFILTNAIFNNVLARLSGVAAIGFAIGLMVMLADALFREAWIEVRYGPRDARTVTLGQEPVRVGSDNRQCEIYVPNVPAIAFVYRLEKGQIMCDDYVNNRRGAVRAGVGTTIGNVSITPFGGARS